jgi:hypothetical protein
LVSGKYTKGEELQQFCAQCASAKHGLFFGEEGQGMDKEVSSNDGEENG